MKAILSTVIVIVVLQYETAFAQALALPDGYQTDWVIEQAEEIVQYITFDPSTVESKLPKYLRFITIKELADNNIKWANDYLTDFALNGSWGVSFLEIVRMQTFMIDARSPTWPEHGAIAMWAARVALSDSSLNLDFGRPLLILDFWVPDSTYVAYMAEKGHYARYGDIKLYKDKENQWQGSIKADGLRAITTCKASGEVLGGANSRGTQTLFPPSSSFIKQAVQISFAGHRVQECDGNSSWNFQGTHPLIYGIPVGTSNYEFGYNLIGGAYLLKE